VGWGGAGAVRRHGASVADELRPRGRRRHVPLHMRTIHMCALSFLPPCLPATSANDDSIYRHILSLAGFHTHNVCVCVCACVCVCVCVCVYPMHPPLHSLLSSLPPVFLTPSVSLSPLFTYLFPFFLSICPPPPSLPPSLHSLPSSLPLLLTYPSCPCKAFFIASPLPITRTHTPFLSPYAHTPFLLPHTHSLTHTRTPFLSPAFAVGTDRGAVHVVRVDHPSLGLSSVDPASAARPAGGGGGGGGLTTARAPPTHPTPTPPAHPPHLTCVRARGRAHALMRVRAPRPCPLERCASGHAHVRAVPRAESGGRWVRWAGCRE
jgi:hypothetical protein